MTAAKQPDAEREDRESCPNCGSFDWTSESVTYDALVDPQHPYYVTSDVCYCRECGEKWEV